MNILQRNKEIVMARNAGAKIVDLSRKYGVSATNLSQMYYDFEKIVDLPYYDTVAAVDLSKQVAPKLIHSLHFYELIYGKILTPEGIKDIDREKFAALRGVGASVMRALDKLQEALR
jgi:hypothetical protein